MVFTVNFRGGRSPDRTSFWYDSNTYVYDSISVTAGNTNLAGSESWVVNDAAVDNAKNIISVSPQRGGTVYVYNNSNTGEFGRNSTAGGSVYDWLGGTWSGGICGYYQWSSVPAIPASIAVSSAGSIVNNTYQTAIALTATGTYGVNSGSNTLASDGGQPITKYQAQYRVTAAGKTITSITRSGTTVTVTCAAHGFVAGNVVQVYGVTGTNASLVNGRWTVASATTNTFTFTTSGSGTISVTTPSALAALYGAWTGAKDITGGTFSFASLTAARYYQFRVYANNTNGSSAGREAASVFANPAAPVWGAKTLNTSITQSTPYSDYLNITGYTLSSNVTVNSGSLPTGLSVSTTQIDSNNARATISGTPTTPGTYTFRLLATNIGGSTVSSSYTLNVASNSTVWNSPGKGSLNNADGTAYALRNEVVYNPSGVSGIVASGDYLYAVGAVTNGYSIAGSLPAGITATNTTGTINGATVNIYRFSGTPTVSGTFNFTVTVSTGGTPIDQPVSITVRPTAKRFTTTSISPYTTSAVSTNVATWKRYDVSGWVDVRAVKKWNGTDWVNVDRKSVV